ncbi:nucleotidyltransferase domain-containing protein [Rossellomorea sp. SC111]|uniref:nucleotidyltransferase domain-containing protein n=1 Tax=Rossellomorea sp. SC111 TaxID=2968985 RepID=UPI00215B22DA|nr:nucleotidyltransferase domain-containing protein [Rossellomorea sp. SC111]MCR8848198.1 nucleotidyltransferase domain-containing protein [Rossellomorea sp. SC111]
MRQELAVEKVLDSLKKNSSVRSVFLKGSMGRKEHDEHSDIDLYCLVKEGEEKEFLTRRLDHLKAYKDFIFHDDIFIIAPQIIAIYEDWLHIDLFTVTEKTFQEKDFFTVLYDPDNLLGKYKPTQNLTISKEQFKYNVLDAPWFLFQYQKAAARGNYTWAVEMLRHSMRNVITILLSRYAKERAVLGLMTIHRDLPQEVQDRVVEIYEAMTPSCHSEAAWKIASLLESEFDWIRGEIDDGEVASFMELMIGKVLVGR